MSESIGRCCNPQRSAWDSVARPSRRPAQRRVHARVAGCERLFRRGSSSLRVRRSRVGEPSSQALSSTTSTEPPAPADFQEPRAGLKWAPDTIGRRDRGRGARALHLNRRSGIGDGNMARSPCGYQRVTVSKSAGRRFESCHPCDSAALLTSAYMGSGLGVFLLVGGCFCGLAICSRAMGGRRRSVVPRSRCRSAARPGGSARPRSVLRAGGRRARPARRHRGRSSRGHRGRRS